MMPLSKNHPTMRRGFARPSIIGMLTLILLSFILSSCGGGGAADSLVRVNAGDVIATGILVDKAGYVVSGAQAVKGADSFSVELKPGVNYAGRVICTDSARDIAVIKIEGNYPALKPVLLGDSDLVHQWDEVNATGYRPGDPKQVTLKGAVTGLQKAGGINYLQTNAALEPGLAGSVITDKSGEMVGMVSWNSGQAGREGYALSSNEVKTVLSQALEAESTPLTIITVDPPAIYGEHIIVAWRTSRPSSGQVEYGPQATYGNKTAPEYTLLESHSAVVQNLQPKTSYHLRVRSVDCCGVEAISKDYIVTTTAATAQGAKFAISNVDVYDIVSTAATVRWITNKPATSLVDYGEDKSGVTDTESDNTPVYEHKVRLGALRPDTRYNVSIKSVTDFDEAEQQVLAPFNTPPASPVCCKINCRLSDFAFKTLQGGDFTSRDILGKKVFMVFTKTSCPTCMQQAIFLNDVYTSWPKGTDMMMFMVASSEKKADIEEWIKKYGLSMPVYIDPTAQLVSGCQFRTIPTALLLDTGSVIRDYKSGGFGNKKDMETTVKRFYETER